MVLGLPYYISWSCHFETRVQCSSGPGRFSIIRKVSALIRADQLHGEKSHDIKHYKPCAYT